MVFEHQSYRSFLRGTLAERQKSREGNSLRAFSQKLGVSNSHLSDVLNGKKSLSMELAFKIAVKLDLTEAETQYLCLLVQLDQEKDPVFREELTKRLAVINPQRKSYDLSVDHFKAIAEWHHYAILELTYITGFRLEPDAAAKKLGISKVEAEIAIDRLKRLDLLERDERGHYRKTHSNIVFQSQTPNGALKLYHKQVLQKALESIDAQTPAERMSATDILPIDSKHLPEVDRLSREFSSAVIQLSEKSKVKDRVYALSVHFFGLSRQEQRS
jgi:uncharacterized protein (TIGR02147 family)